MKKNKAAKELLLEYLENINDAEKAILLFANDAVIELPYLNSLGMPWQWKGKDALYDLLKIIPKPFIDFEFSNIQIHIETPDQVFGEYSVACKEAVTGLSYLQTYMGRLVAENGKIKLLREALDMTHVTENMFSNFAPYEKNTILGIDHIGMNVPDIDTATIFLQKAFDAEVVYESYSKKELPLEFEGVEST